MAWVLAPHPLCRASVSVGLTRAGIECVAATDDADLAGTLNSRAGIAVVVTVAEPGTPVPDALAATVRSMMRARPWLQWVRLQADRGRGWSVSCAELPAATPRPARRGRTPLYVGVVLAALRRSHIEWESWQARAPRPAPVAPATQSGRAGGCLRGTDLSRCVSAIDGLERIRQALFGDVVAMDPLWSMVAQLLDAAMTGDLVPVTALCEVSGAPETTARRRLAQLEERDVVEFVQDSTDRRRSFVRLTAAGADRLGEYLTRLSVLFRQGED